MENNQTHPDPQDPIAEIIDACGRSTAEFASAVDELVALGMPRAEAGHALRGVCAMQITYAAYLRWRSAVRPPTPGEQVDP
jgi:hypothetical protein